MTSLSIWFALLLMVAVVIVLLPWLASKEAMPASTKRKTLVAALSLPLLSFGAYAYLGTPQFAEMSTSKAPPKTVTLVDKLAEKLEKNPKDLASWVLLGRSYMATESYHEAVKAFEKAYALDPNNLAIILPLADALAITHAGSIEGRSYELLKQALDIDPDNTIALWLLGIAERQHGDAKQALVYWRKLYTLLPPEHSDRKIIAGYFAQMNRPLPKESHQELKPLPAVDKIEIGLTFSEAIKQKLAGHLVFVVIKNSNGQPMPLAAKRLLGAALPSSIVMTQADFLLPNTKLVDLKTYVVGVRVYEGNQMDASKLVYRNEVPSRQGLSETFILDF